MQWTEDQRSSFNNLKQALISSPTLSYPSPDSNIYHLVSDTSQMSMGAALYQIIDFNPVPLGFYSKKFSTSQQKYSTYDRELLAAYSAVIHFRYLIDSNKIILFTDYKPWWY